MIKKLLSSIEFKNYNLKSQADLYNKKRQSLADGNSIRSYFHSGGYYTLSLNKT